MLSISSFWARGTLAQAEASWQAAESGYSASAALQDIGGNMTWSCYHGAFDEWVTRIGGLSASDRYIGSNRMHFAFFDFMNQRFEHTKYLVTASARNQADPTAQIVKRIEYRDSLWRRRSICLLTRTAGTDR